MESVLIVTNAVDGRRYRLVIKGSLARISGEKIKKYMTGHIGASARGMSLKFQGTELLNGMTAGDVGAKSGDNLFLEPGPGIHNRASYPETTSIASSSLPNAHLLEAESLDDQRELFEVETERRQQAYAKSIQDLAHEVTEKDRRAQMLEADLKERQYQVKRLEEERLHALAERHKIEDLRRQELDRQKQREAELLMREEKLLEERNRHRELELHRLDLERKQQLLQQQRSEAEKERQRVERDRREYEEQIVAQEEEIRQKQARLERERLEHARRERELERHKAQLAVQRQFELTTFGKERDLDNHRLMEIRNAAFNMNRAQAPHASTPRADPSPLASKEAPTTGNGFALLSPRPSLAPGGGGASRSPTFDTAGPGAAAKAACRPTLDCAEMAEANLEDLSNQLGQYLQFDATKTCVVDVDDRHTIMISYDSETEGLYIYSSLLCNLPSDPAVKIQLYELLLEGALLGRDMAGGGVGLSLKDDFILMCTSISLHSCTTYGLRLAVPVFAEALRRWRKRIRDLLVGPSPGREREVSDAWRPDVRTPASAGRSESCDESYAVIGVELTDGVTIGGVHTQYNSGVIVVRVKGPAAASGMQENDIIKFVNGQRVSNLSTFQHVTATLTPDVPSVFIVQRDGQELSLEVRPTRGFKKPGERRRYSVAEDALQAASRS